MRAVAAVLVAARFTVTDLDASLGDTSSADLLVNYEAERRLVEVKSAAGNAGEALVARLEQHVQTWPLLRPDEPVGGGVLVVNHQHRREPGERDAAVYTRAAFVGSLAVPVLATRQLFDWWRDADWTAIRDAVLARPGESAARAAAPATPPPPSAPRAPEAPGNPRGAPRRLLGRRGPRGG